MKSIATEASLLISLAAARLPLPLRLLQGLLGLEAVASWFCNN